MSLLSRELRFQLHECLRVAALCDRPRYADQAAGDFDAILEVAESLAADRFAPHLAAGDVHEPQFVDGAVRTIPETRAAWQAFADAGFLSAHWSQAEGGIQLPEPVYRAAMAHFFAANVATAGYPFLTIGAANLLRTFGNDELKRRFLPALGDGRSAGTMALTEPAQGSALGDIRTQAVPQPDGSWRITGQKMFISGGDQDLTDNIVHMVLARAQGAPAGVKGISLFLVPKFLVDDGGRPTRRNDVALAGLLHKMGWRNTTSTVLSFGEQGGATGWLLGEQNRGLAHMFQMMNEARVGVGLIAACLAYRGFVESLAYARQRPQGRLPSARDPRSPQVMLVAHADVRRLLLAQKMIAEGALALCLQASAWVEDEQTHPDPGMRRRAGRMLDLLTPVVKSWPSKHGCRSNEMGVQVLGGSGYTREYPLEQLYRDQRLNPIHEGAEAIQELDLLGRKLRADEGEGWLAWQAMVRADAALAPPPLRELAGALERALAGLVVVTEDLLQGVASDPDRGLANATEFLDAFGRVAIAWIWLRQATVAQVALDSLPADDPGRGYYLGKLQAARYCFEWDLPLLQPQLALLACGNTTPYTMQDGWFA